MAQTINHLIENPEIRKNMSANTYLDKEKLSITTIIKQWKSLFDEEELK
jgi:glycosyltransferase involved in cell wall biosynthesis